MWRLFEARMRPVLWELAATIGAGVLLGLILVIRYDALRATPERMASIFGFAVLLTVSLYRWSMLGLESKESRLALLITLPVTLRGVALGQIIELAVVPFLVAAAALVAGILGRALAGGPAETFPLWQLGIVACSVLVFDQLAMLSDQLRSHRQGRRPSPLLIWGLLMAAGAFIGMLFRHGPRPVLATLETLRPIIVSEVSILAGLAVAAALALLNVWLFIRRPGFID